ncbi:MAG: hypothetical protein WA672_06665 [Candidatus Angelobacter sp.]
MPRRHWQVNKHTGSLYEYPYRSLTQLNEDSVAKYCSSLRRRFGANRKTPEAAEQWIARTYISLKYLLAASVMLTSAEFAATRNLRIVEPYLLYYSLFNSSRALCLMIPELQWKGGAVIESLSHTKVQNLTVDCLGHLSAEVADQYKDVYERALVSREMLSYRFPAQGLTGRLAKILPPIDDVVDSCQIVAEVAQLHSECLQSAFKNLPSVGFPETSEPLRKFFQYEHKSLGTPLIDQEDWYRKWQFIRHSSRPVSLHLVAREGLIEDFFGAWSYDGEKPDQYDADKADWGIIFDFF